MSSKCVDANGYFYVEGQDDGFTDEIDWSKKVLGQFVLDFLDSDCNLRSVPLDHEIRTIIKTVDVANRRMSIDLIPEVRAKFVKNVDEGESISTAFSNAVMTTVS